MRLGAPHHDEIWLLEVEAFGLGPARRDPFLGGLAHVHPYGLVEDGRLAAMVLDRPYQQRYGGYRSVAVTAEAGGRGLDPRATRCVGGVRTPPTGRRSSTLTAGWRGPRTV